MKSAIEKTKSEHAIDLMSGLNSTREKPFASDFKIEVSGESFPVHRNVLVSCSKYFKGMFDSGMIEAQQEYTDMKKSDPDAVKQCIDFMYTGEANITLENVESILNVATMLELTRLTSLCSIFLKENVNLENCIQIREITQKYDCECGKFIQDFIDEELKLMINDDDPNKLLIVNRTVLKRYLEASKISHGLKWKAVKQWIQGNAENKETIQTHLNDLMDVSQYPVNFLMDEVLKDSLVQSCKHVHKMVADAVFKDIGSLSDFIFERNCVFIKKFVQEYKPTNTTEINEAADKCIREHFDESSVREDFKQLPTEECFAFFEHSETKFRSEKHKIQFAIDWIKQNERERKEFLVRLFTSVKMERLSKDFVIDIIQFETLINNSPDVKNLFPKYSLSRHDKKKTVPRRPVEIHIAMFDRETGEIKLFDPKKENITLLTEVYKQNFMKIVSVDGELYMVRDKNIVQYQKGEGWTIIAEMQQVPDSETQVLNFQNQIYVIGKERMGRLDIKEKILDESLPGCGFSKKFVVAATDKYIYALDQY